MKVTTMSNRPLMEADDILSSNKRIKVPVKNLPGMESTNQSQFRLDYAKKSVSRIIQGINSLGWSEVKESDPDYSNFTSTRILGDQASELGIKLIDLAKNGKLNMEEEEFADEGYDKSYRFEIPGFDDAQIFFNDSKDANKDEVILVVRPIEVNKEVTIVV